MNASFAELFAVFFGAMVVNNIILMRFLGLCSFFGVSDRLKNSLGMSAAVLFVMTLATLVSWPVYHFILKPMDLVFLRTVSFILIIASLVQFVEIVMKKYFMPLYKALGIYLPLITTNCAILAVAFLNIDYGYSIVKALVYTWGVAGGYALAIILFASVREKIKTAPIPRFLDGYPIVFFTAALMAVAFMGFTGLFGIR